MSKWQKACETAKSDATLVAIARGIVALNRAGRYEDAKAGHLAIRDRAEELGIVLPNEGYRPLLFSVLIRD